MSVFSRAPVCEVNETLLSFFTQIRHYMREHEREYRILMLLIHLLGTFTIDPVGS